MINVSTLSIRFSITEILLDTFAPPRIATKGLSGLFTAFPRKSISFCIKYPTTAVSTYFVTPTLEQCARCAVPNASFTNTSQREARSLLKASSNESFGYNTDEIVSSDIVGMRYGSLFDATQTMVRPLDNGTTQVQVVSWYDNENSYTSQMVRTIKYFSELA